MSKVLINAGVNYTKNWICYSFTWQKDRMSQRYLTFSRNNSESPAFLLMRLTFPLHPCSSLPSSTQGPSPTLRSLCFLPASDSSNGQVWHRGRHYAYEVTDSSKIYKASWLSTPHYSACCLLTLRRHHN